MSVSAALRELLVSDIALAARVGGRVHLETAPGESRRPLVVYRLVATRPVMQLVGRAPLARWWYQVGVRADRAAEAEQIAGLIRLRIDGHQAPPGAGAEAIRWIGRVTGWDPVLDAHAVDDDYAVWARP